METTLNLFAPTFFGYDILQINMLSISIRMVMAIAFGACLGFERVRKRRAAGLRTYMLVCIASASVMMVSQFINSAFSVTADVGRLGAQVISGIGFLGAGTILLTGQHRIKGLTTAAGLWATACMGLTIGIGFYFGAIALFVSIFSTMTIVALLEKLYIRRQNSIELYIVISDIKYIRNLRNFVNDNSMQILDLEIMKVTDTQGVYLSCRVKFGMTMDSEASLNLLNQCEGIDFLEEVNPI